MIKINPYGGRTIFYYNKINVNHRANGLPALIFSDGTKYYFENGLKHRANGLPAIEYGSGIKYYFINGKEYFPKENDSN